MDWRIHWLALPWPTPTLPASAPAVRSVGPASPTCVRTACAAAWRSAASAARSRCDARATVPVAPGSAPSIPQRRVHPDRAVLWARQSHAQYASNSARFIPCSAQKSVETSQVYSDCKLWICRAYRTTPINAFQQHRQLRSRQRHRAITGLRPHEATPLQPLGIQAHPIAIPPQHLDQIAAPATEDKHVSRERTLLQLRLHQPTQPVEAASQIRYARRNPDVRLRWQRDHR